MMGHHDMTASSLYTQTNQIINYLARKSMHAVIPETGPPITKDYLERMHPLHALPRNMVIYSGRDCLGTLMIPGKGTGAEEGWRFERNSSTDADTDGSQTISDLLFDLQKTCDVRIDK